MKKKKLDLSHFDKELAVRAIINTLRIIKTLHPHDLYWDNYVGMLKRYPDFFDSYMLMWNIGIKLQPKRILEIGSRTGISLCQLLSSYIDTSVLERVVCVDPFLDGFANAAIIIKNLQYLGLPHDHRVQIVVSKSEVFVPTLVGEEFDYILVDGDHSKPAARQDLENVVPLCKKGGIIVFDDISTAPGECALIDQWDDWANAHKKEFDFNVMMQGKGVAWAIKK